MVESCKALALGLSLHAVTKTNTILEESLHRHLCWKITAEFGGSAKEQQRKYRSSPNHTVATNGLGLAAQLPPLLSLAQPPRWEVDEKTCL